MIAKSITKEFNRINVLLDSEMTLQSIYEISTIREHYNASEYIVGNKLKIKKYRDIKKAVNATSFKIHKAFKDIPKNSMIGFVCPTSPQWHVFLWSFLKAGYKPILINEKSSESDIQQIMDEAKATVLVSNKELNTKCDLFLTSDLYDESISENISYWANEIIFCTSGTEGKQKLLVYSGKNLCHQIASAKDLPFHNIDIMYTEYQGKYRNLVLLPFSHIFGFVAVYLWSFFFNKTLLYPEDLSINSIKRLSKKTKITHVYSVPMFWNHISGEITKAINKAPVKKQKYLKDMMDYNNGILLDKPKGIGYAKIYFNEVKKRIFGPHIKFLISGGGFVREDTIKTINGVGYCLHNGYGLTEAGVCSVDLSKERIKMNLNSVGKPFYGISYKIKDNLPEGELLIKSEILYNFQIVNGVQIEHQPDWFASGDIVRQDEDYRFYIVGRQKEIIINENGENLAPDEIENHFYNGLDIVSLCCVAIDNRYLALVIQVKKDFKEEHSSELRDQLDDRNYMLSSYKRVNEYYITKDPLPVEISMKPSRIKVIQNIKNSKYEAFDSVANELDTTESYSNKDLDKYIEVITSLVSDMLLVEENNVLSDNNLVTTYNFDSFMYIELILKLEQHYDIVISNDEGSSCANIIKFAILVRKKLREKI